jgi:hypothetical protein
MIKEFYMVNKFKTLFSVSSKGLSLIECSLFLAISMFTIVGLASLIEKDQDPQAVEVAVLEPASEPAYSTAVSLKRLKEHGPTEHQLELLRQANEDLAERNKREADQSTKKSLVETLNAQPKTVTAPLVEKVQTAQVPAPPKKTAPSPNVSTTTSEHWEQLVTGSEVALSLKTGKSYATIYWGDGSSENVYANGSFQGSHKYSSDGPHSLRIEGTDFQVLSKTSAPGV